MKKIICLFTCLFNFSTVSCTDVATIKRVKVSDEFDYSVRKKRKTIKKATPEDLYTKYCNDPKSLIKNLQNTNCNELNSILFTLKKYNFFCTVWNIQDVAKCINELEAMNIKDIKFDLDYYFDSCF